MPECDVGRLLADLIPISLTGRFVGSMYGESVSSSRRSTWDVLSVDDAARLRITAAVLRLLVYVATPASGTSEVSAVLDTMV